jgi:hypothetical protein
MPSAKLYARRMKLVAVIIASMLPSLALAESRPVGPMPQPAIGAACPTGYQRSFGTSMPGPNTKCRAFPKSGATCPVGFTTSFEFCVETGCQSR